MYMPTKKLRRGLIHSKKIRGGMFLSTLFGPSTQTSPAKTTNATTIQQLNATTIEQLNAKMDDILKRVIALENKNNYAKTT